MDLKFNLHGLAEPKTQGDFSALLIETLRAVQELSAMIDADEKFLQACRQPIAA